MATNAKLKRVSGNEFQITLTPARNQWLPLDIMLPTGKGGTDLEISWFTDEDPRPRAFPVRRILLPWARPESAQPEAVAERTIPEISGGDWERGKKVFFGEQVACFKCHRVAGEGGNAGPDLSNLYYRDYKSVLNDIKFPSAAINPDHIAYNIDLKDGEMVTGVILEDTAQQVTLAQATGKNVVVEKSKISAMKASRLSLMPEGLLKALTDQQQRDFADVSADDAAWR